MTNVLSKALATMMADLLEPAFILHSRNYRDSSLIVDLLTKGQGRYSVVVRGGRSKRSKNRGRLQLFTPILIASIGKGELKTATSIDYPGRPYKITGEKLYLGMYVNELLYRLLERFDPVEEIYEAYEFLLSVLQGEGSGISAIREFELLLLQALGYGISFEFDAADGQSVEPDAYYRFIPQQGFVRTVLHEANDSDLLYPGVELYQLAEGLLELVNQKRLRILTRQSLAPLLGDKPLKSRSLFRSAVR